MKIREFKVRDLSILAYAQGFTMWHYKSMVLHDVMISGWFDDAASMINVGDAILVTGPTGACVLSVVSSGDRVVVREFGLTNSIAQGG
jgi:hypothetical protein